MNDKEKKIKKDLEIVIKKSTKHNVHISKGSIELIKELLEESEIKETIYVTPFKQTMGAPHLKGLKVQDFNGQSVTISVQPGDNNTRRIYYIQIPKGFQSKEFFKKLETAAAMLKLYDTKKEGEMKVGNKEKKQQGFLNDPEKTAIVLMEIKEKFGKSEILDRKVCVDSILKFMPADTPRVAIGPIMGKIAREGFLKQVRDKYFPDRITGYKFTQTAVDYIKKYSAVKIEETQLPQTETTKITKPVVEIEDKEKIEVIELKKEDEEEEKEKVETAATEPFFKKIMREFAEIKNKLARIEKENSELKMDLGEFRLDKDIQFILLNIEEINKQLKSFDGKLKFFDEIHCEFEKIFAPLRDSLEYFNKYAEIQKQKEALRECYEDQQRDIAEQEKELKKNFLTFNLSEIF